MSLAPVKGFVMVCAAFYERAIWGTVASVPPLPTPVLWLGVTSPDSFEDAAYGGLRDSVWAYIGIEPPLNLWSQFFQAWLWQDSSARVASVGSVDISVCSSLEANSYFSFMQPSPPVGWRKAWFLLKNEADASFPVFMSGCPIPHPNWEHGVVLTNFPRLQPLLEIVQGLLQKGLTGDKILWTFLSHWV
jgi:hypothetical protein